MFIARKSLYCIIDWLACSIIGQVLSYFQAYEFLRDVEELSNDMEILKVKTSNKKEAVNIKDLDVSEEEEDEEVDDDISFIQNRKANMMQELLDW